MGSITANCGHKISVKWMLNPKSNITINSETREGEPCISYMVVCRKCRKEYKDLIVDESKPRREGGR